MELGDHLGNAGHFEYDRHRLAGGILHPDLEPVCSEARRQYSRTRDYCTNAQQVVDVFVKGAEMAVLTSNWELVLSLAGKAKLSKAFSTNVRAARWLINFS